MRTLQIQDVNLAFGEREILKNISFTMDERTRAALAGANGSGKSTLMKIIAGVESSYQGEVVWAPGYSVGYLEQEPVMDDSKTVIDVVREGVGEVMEIQDEAEAFARAAAALYGDPEACGRLSRKAQTYVRSHYSMDAAWEVIREDFEEA